MEDARTAGPVGEDATARHDRVELVATRAPDGGTCVQQLSLDLLFD